jgi:serine/threonine protein kinase
MEYKGVPPINVMEESTRSEFFFDENLDPLPVKNSRGGIRKPSTKSLTKLLETKDKNFIRFIDNCLHWDPNLRLTPEEALCHDWILEGFTPSQIYHPILSQYQSQPDIDRPKLPIFEHTQSIDYKNLQTPKVKNNKVQTQKIQFQNFMGDEEIGISILSKSLFKLSKSVEIYDHENKIKLYFDH